MANIFFASDHHFSHEKLVAEFKREDGSPLRDFANADEMNEYIIKKHNEVVRPQDKIYMLGDVVFHNKYLHIVGRLNGEKVLIKGNHDLLKPEQYLQYFKDIRAVHQFKGIVMSHIPIHPDSLGRWGFNIHGHLHSYRVKDQFGKPDPRYFNVSMECLDDYTPISLEQIKLINNL
jgi:calcineurin-like phosphoesterase family protein